MFKIPSSADAFGISVPGYIASLVPYLPGKPIEELERKYGITGSIKRAGRQVLAFLSREIARLGLNTVPTQATFCLVEVPVDTRVAYDPMQHQGVIIRPLNAYGMANTIRVHASLPEENERFIKALGHVLLELRGAN